MSEETARSVVIVGTTRDTTMRVEWSIASAKSAESGLDIFKL